MPTLTVSNNVDHTKDQSVLGPHRDVTPLRVSRNRSFRRSSRQKFVHLPDAPNLITCSVDGEDEDKDDREEYGCVGAVRAEKLDHPRRFEKGWGLTSRRGGWLAYHLRRRR